jgi:hypothetical protein
MELIGQGDEAPGPGSRLSAWRLNPAKARTETTQQVIARGEPEPISPLDNANHSCYYPHCIR